MANSTASIHPTATQPKKQRKPEPGRVVETYYYEVKARGQWGAFTRTAAIYRLSDETIRRYVKQAEQPAAPPLDAEIAYQPAPGEKPIAPRTLPQFPQKQRRDRPKCHTICHSRILQQSGLLCKPVRSDVAKVAQNQTPTFHSAERETVPLDTGKLPHLAVPRSYPRRPAPRPSHATMLDWIRGNLFAPGPALALLVFLALLWLVAR